MNLIHLTHVAVEYSIDHQLIISNLHNFVACPSLQNVCPSPQNRTNFEVWVLSIISVKTKLPSLILQQWKAGERTKFIPRDEHRGRGGRQMLSIIFVEIIAAIFDFYSSGRLGRKENLYQGGERQSKEGEGGWALPCPPSPTINSNSKSNMAVWIKNHEPH